MGCGSGYSSSSYKGPKPNNICQRSGAPRRIKVGGRDYYDGITQCADGNRVRECESKTSWDIDNWVFDKWQNLSGNYVQGWCRQVTGRRYYKDDCCIGQRDSLHECGYSWCPKSRDCESIVKNRACAGDNITRKECQENICTQEKYKDWCNLKAVNYCEKKENTTSSFCTNFCNKNPSMCKNAMKEYCNNFGIFKDEPVCRTFCKDINNKDVCDEIVKHYCLTDEGKNKDWCAYYYAPAPRPYCFGKVKSGAYIPLDVEKADCPDCMQVLEAEGNNYYVGDIEMTCEYDETVGKKVPVPKTEGSTPSQGTENTPDSDKDSDKEPTKLYGFTIPKSMESTYSSVRSKIVDSIGEENADMGVVGLLLILIVLVVMAVNMFLFGDASSAGYQQGYGY